MSPAEERCDICEGSGDCPECDGKGKSKSGKRCSECEGDRRCSKCNGTGKEK